MLPTRVTSSWKGGENRFFSREVGTYVWNILGNVLVTIQTGDERLCATCTRTGLRHRARVLPRPFVDREAKSVLIMASTEGGMDIEDVAEATPSSSTRSTLTQRGPARFPVARPRRCPRSPAPRRRPPTHPWVAVHLFC